MVVGKRGRTVPVQNSSYFAQMVGSVSFASLVTEVRSRGSGKIILNLEETPGHGRRYKLNDIWLQQLPGTCLRRSDKRVR